jgi:hypothetical protein
VLIEASIWRKTKTSEDHEEVRLDGDLPTPRIKSCYGADGSRKFGVSTCSLHQLGFIIFHAWCKLKVMFSPQAVALRRFDE